MKRNRLWRATATAVVLWYADDNTDGAEAFVPSLQFAGRTQKTPSMLWSSTTNIQQSISFSVPRQVSREEGEQLIDQTLVPSSEYGIRLDIGRDAQGLPRDEAFTVNDPRLDNTYGEFPLSSMDELLDLGVQYLDDKRDDLDPKDERSHISMVDVGSGFSRLVLYASLTRGRSDKIPNQKSDLWDVHGIEISELLHRKAVEAAHRGIDAGWILPADQALNLSTEGSNRIHLYQGPAEDYQSILSEADIIFAYSTVFKSGHFSPEVGALLLGPEWSQLLGEACRPGCVAITTDRALDPAFGWKLMERLDVDNREVLGSTGFIHVKT